MKEIKNVVFVERVIPPYSPLKGVSSGSLAIYFGVTIQCLDPDDRNSDSFLMLAGKTIVVSGEKEKVDHFLDILFSSL